MIIDVHAHMAARGFVRGKYMKDTADMSINIYNRVHKTNLTISELIEKRRWYIDPEGDKLVATMDEAGVDKAVIFTVDWAPYTGEPPVTIREQNKIHADVAKKHVGRLIALCGLDPRRGNLMELAKEAIEEWGMRGFKLMPSIGFYPTDPCCMPLYEKCCEWRVPIVFHSGPELRWEFARPEYIATVATQFPEMKVVMAHAADVWWETAARAAELLPNVYLDLSLKQMQYGINPQKFYQWLRDIIDAATPEKLLWATDWPLADMFVHLPEWVKAFTEPKTDIKFTKEEIDLIMGKSALSVFNFD